MPTVTDTATIQNQISDPLRRAIEPLLAPPATVFDQQIKSLEALLAKADDLPKGTVQSTRESLRALEEAREKTNRDHLDAVRSNIATALVAAVRAVDSRVPLTVKQPEAGGTGGAAIGGGSREGNGQAGDRGSAGRKTRMSRAEANELAERVLKVLPTARSGRWISRSEIVEKSGVDNESLQSILIKLKRDEEAESNGQRGAAGGWRRTE